MQLSNKTISVKLEDVLERQGMTMTELAERVGITMANMSILKTGKAKAIRFTTLEAICRELNCQPGDILKFEELLTEFTPPPYF